jgi:cation/acetate symporter
LGLTLFYMSLHAPWGRGLHQALGQPELWGGIQPISSGVFGVPFGFAIIVAVTLLEQALQPAPRRP